MTAAGGQPRGGRSGTAESTSDLAGLYDVAAVRERCRLVHGWVAGGRSPHFTLAEGRLAAVADCVAEVTRRAYPGLDIPPHSRWRHFSAGGVDRWRELAGQIGGGPLERARAAVDLTVVSVLLDAGAGDAWRYREHRTGHVLARSEGLAVASLDMFRAGSFSSDRGCPCRVDDIALATIDAATLASGLQCTPEHPLIGIEGRSALLRRLATALAARPDVFGRAPARPGNLVDHLLRAGGRVAAPRLLALLLETLSSIWPSGLVLDGFPVGDAGRHPAARAGDRTDGVVPFHKLSQWLTYSLIEPLEAAGLAVERLEELTALTEYRNGGLLVDLGVIRPRARLDARERHEASSEMVVEWRALTVALMDPLVELVRARLDLGAGFTMAQLLQGGTWSAGREIACKLRPPEGPSPIGVAADGTLF